MLDLSATDIRSRLAGYARHAACPHGDGPGLIHAAVLVPLYPEENSLHILLTRRTDTVETHKGQIAFPGGIVDPGDRDRVHTALRETEEELGIDPGAIETIGILDDLATPTGFCITPVVGVLAARPAMRPNTEEVADVFTVPLSFFLEPSHAERSVRETPGGRREIWTYRYCGREIWGATAAIIRGMTDILLDR